MKDAIRETRERLHRLADNAHVHVGHEWMHLGYFVLVFVEGHGVYTFFGGALALFVLLDILGNGEA